MMRAVLDRYPNGHVVVLDPHNEYSQCFGDTAVIFDPTNLSMPYWMLTFELVEILYPGRKGYDEEIEILADLIPAGKKMGLHAAANGAKIYATRGDAAAITVDTPLPYRISDILGLIDKSLGGLDSTRSIAPYKRLRNRLFAISQDARYAFMFGGLTVKIRCRTSCRLSSAFPSRATGFDHRTWRPARGSRAGRRLGRGAACLRVRSLEPRRDAHRAHLRRCASLRAGRP